VDLFKHCASRIILGGGVVATKFPVPKANIHKSTWTFFSPFYINMTLLKFVFLGFYVQMKYFEVPINHTESMKKVSSTP